MKIGDVSRRRRFTDPVRQRWYAYHRAVRFARRCLGADARVICVACAGGWDKLAPG